MFLFAVDWILSCTKRTQVTNTTECQPCIIRYIVFKWHTQSKIFYLQRIRLNLPLSFSNPRSLFVISNSESPSTSRKTDYNKRNLLHTVLSIIWLDWSHTLLSLFLVDSAGYRELRDNFQICKQQNKSLSLIYYTEQWYLYIYRCKSGIPLMLTGQLRKMITWYASMRFIYFTFYIRPISTPFHPLS